MSDWQTVKRAILEETNKLNDSNIVERVMCEALRDNRILQVWFNEGFHTILTAADKYDYDLPDDFLFVIGDPIYTPSGSSSSSRYPLTGRSRQFIEDNKYTTSDLLDDGELESGRSVYYATDNGKIYVLPVPDTAGDEIEFRYIKDLGTPYTKYSGSAWTTYDPDTNVAISSTYTNAWFNEGQDATRLRALYHLYSRHYGNDKAAGAALQQWLEATRLLKTRTTKAKGRAKIRGHF